MPVHAEVVALHQHALSGREVGTRALLHAARQLHPGHEREDPRHTVPGTGDHGVLEIDGGPLHPDEDLAFGEVRVGQLDHRRPDDRSRLGEQIGREAHGFTVEGLPSFSGPCRCNGYVRTVTTIAGYGGWSSPLAAGDVARAKVSLSELCSDDEAVYWLESRPAEAGRTVVVRSEPSACPTTRREA